MLYKYKDAFHLRNEIATFLDIVVEIGVRDKSTLLLEHTM